LRRKPVQLGGGGEVLTVLWDAVARIRELVTAESRGVLKFQNIPVIDALPSAGWMTGASRRPHAGRAPSVNEVREGGEPLPLDGFRICVAEDDLSTNWFLCGVLREAGATVTGYFDGRKALDHAYREFPDLLMTDIVMPELDGFALCRAVKRDVLLRSVPVLLLSWKTDLLQRMRELGAGADGYLLKEASGNEILQRVHELLRPRRIVERRIADGGTVRGRLDGLSAVALLKIVSKVRPMCRISVRDARFLYEIEMRAGRPVLATRTEEDGTTTRGPNVVASLLGVGGGRFSVCDIDEGAALAVELDGSLDEQLLAPIARARASQTFLTGTQLMRVHRVGLSEEILDVCLDATPEPARSLVRAIANGATPRDLIAEGRASAELVERVLCDAARQGAITSVQMASGEMLTAAIEREVAVMSGVELPPEERMITAADAYVGIVVAEDDPPPVDMAEELISNTPTDVLVGQLGSEELTAEEIVAGESLAPATPIIARAVAPNESRDTPILARVVAEAPAFAEVAPEIDHTAELDDVDDVDDDDDDTPSPSARTHAKRRRKKRRRRKDRGRREERHARSDAYDEDDFSEDPPPVTPSPEPRPRRERGAAFTHPEADAPRLPRLPMPSAWATRGAEPPVRKKSSRWVAPLVFGLVGISLAIGARYMRERQPLEPEQPMIITPQVGEPGASEGTDPVTQLPTPPAADGTAAPLSPSEQPVELPLSKKEAAKLKKGQGLLEIVAGRGHTIFVDGKRVGQGPVVKVPVKATAQPHEIRVKMTGEERVRYVVVKPKTRLRLRVAPPWSR
jgi:CheY-like chemotaxis protein